MAAKYLNMFFSRGERERGGKKKKYSFFFLKLSLSVDKLHPAFDSDAGEKQEGWKTAVEEWKSEQQRLGHTPPQKKKRKRKTRGDF